MKLASRLSTLFFAVVLSGSALAGCDNSESSSGAGGTGGSTATTSDSTTSSDTTTSDTTTSDTTTSSGPVALTPQDLVGEWVGGCEAYPNGQGGENYLTRDFTLTDKTWDLSFSLYADAACTTSLFTAKIHGPYTLGGVSAKVDGATEGQFGFETNDWTAHVQQMADTFTASGCGSAPWEVEVSQDVTKTGCIGVAHKVADCPQEYDLVGIKDDGKLYFGERITDMCSEAGRPAALGPFGLTKK